MKSRTSFYGFLITSIFILLFITAGCNAATSGSGDFASIPVGKGYSEGEEIFFSHTEASDQDISTTLTNMMKSPVIYVPASGKSPEEMLAKVYVFENGISGRGPLGYQVDVFDNPPGTTGYSPLRKIIKVKWNDSSKSRLIKSSSDILAAEKNGELVTSSTSVVVNMPFMVWSGGKR